MGIKNFARNIKGEFRHVVWPSQKQTTLFTVLVIVISVAVAYYLNLFDWIFTNILKEII